MSFARTSLATASLTLALAACSGGPTSTFGDPSTSGGSPDNGTNGAQFASSDPLGTNAACVSAIADASLPAVNLVIMYDKSGSMGDPKEGFDPNAKWIPVNTGMKAFFADPASSGYNASLQFFPAPGDVTATCNAPYDTPLVPLTSLSAGAPLAAALDGASPQGGTPTLPALEGAIRYAQQTIAARPTETTVVVLVTDGEPGLFIGGQMVPGCTDNDITHVAGAAAAAAQATPAVPTYVIGVGSSLTALDAIASAGGTDHAFIISVQNPTDTRTQLQAAFDAIRSQVKVSCNFDVPAPPAGQQLDKNHINVGFTAGAGVETPLVYSKDCTSDHGWRYDNPDAPTKIELCPTACSEVQSDPNGKLRLAIGCLTNVEVR